MPKDKKEFIRIWLMGYQAGVNNGYRLCRPLGYGEKADKLAEEAWAKQQQQRRIGS